MRGIAADASATTLVATTARGMYRSPDGGATWALKEANLPIHLEAGPLVRDPGDAATLYAVYSLMPYAEVWRTALEGSNLLARADPVSLAGGVAFLLLLLIAGGLLVRWLARRRRRRSAVARLAVMRMPPLRACGSRWRRARSSWRWPALPPGGCGAAGRAPASSSIRCRERQSMPIAVGR